MSQIQRVLLENDPTLRGGQFTIELNKRITLNGTRHEVDVYVVTHPGTAYESIVLFECKDLKNSVAKKEVIHLKEMVDLVGATRGILVARKMSRDAAALLSTYRRLQYRQFSDDITSFLKLNVEHTVHESVSTVLRVTPRNREQLFPPNLGQCVYRWGNRVGTFEAFGYERVELIAQKDKESRPSQFDHEGVHWRCFREHLEFDPGEYSIGNIDVSVIEIDAVFFVYVVPHSPVYTCSVTGEGHVLSFDIVDKDFPSGKMDLTFIIADRKGKKLEA